MHTADVTSAVLALFVMAMILAIAEFAKRSVRAGQNEPASPQANARLHAKLSSKGLAGLIVQALVDAKVIDVNQTQDATDIVARKIDLRKALGDY